VSYCFVFQSLAGASKAGEPRTGFVSEPEAP